MQPETIEKALAPLVGLPLRFLGRAADLLWVQFGEMHEVPSRRGGTKTVGDWALHVQCAWRLCRLSSIEIARSDFYYSPEGDVLDEWETSGASRFDQQVASLVAGFATNPPVVRSFTVDDVGGFSLFLSHDLRLDVFPDGSTLDEYSEHWRLFAPNLEGEHFVVPCG